MLELIERAVHYQISRLGDTGKADTSVAEKYEFRHAKEEIEKMKHTDPLIEHLERDDFVYVRYDGTIMDFRKFVC